jgi:hypothetical protein
LFFTVYPSGHHHLYFWHYFSKIGCWAMAITSAGID